MIIQTPIPLDVNVARVSHSEDVIPLYDEALAVPASTPTIINSYTMPILVDTEVFLNLVTASGDNYCIFEVKLNGSTIEKGRTSPAEGYDKDFNFSGENRGLKLLTGDLVEVTCTHYRPFVGDFNSRIQLIIVTY